jgi:shikimate dehydrogenase
MNERIYGLIGFPVSHSFSKKYFSEKFLKEGLSNCFYELFPLPNVADLPGLMAANPRLQGLNVTIPHKESVMSCLDEIDDEARKIGAVNVIKIRDGKLKGYNTDVYGFEKSLFGFLTPFPADLEALVLGTGGASKAVVFVLEKRSIPYHQVSRSGRAGILSYEDITAETLATHRLIINTTPVGMYPAVDNCPAIPYEATGKEHWFYDLVYNPEDTLFLRKAAARGARTCHGLAMLHLQAERAWEIWNEDF